MRTSKPVCGSCGQNYAVVEIRSYTVFECQDLNGIVLDDWEADADEYPSGFYCRGCANDWHFCTVSDQDDPASPEDIAAADADDEEDDEDIP